MKTKAVQTDIDKNYCKTCGTWTIAFDKRLKKPICINLNHNYFYKKNIHKFKEKNNE